MISDLSALGAVSPEYLHVEKYATVGEDLALPTAYLKWYDICRREDALPPVVIAESRAFLRAEFMTGRLPIDGCLGFVEAHRCGATLLLLVFTWNNENELWETAYSKDLTAAGTFSPFEPRDGQHRAMNCVWELAPIWHERQAWARFLLSPRDDAAKRAYLADRYAGVC
ncbi:MAG TPA: hypothetical protein VF792_07035 [Ktedonobacterales bacterium]